MTTNKLYAKRHMRWLAWCANGESLRAALRMTALVMVTCVLVNIKSHIGGNEAGLEVNMSKRITDSVIHTDADQLQQQFLRLDAEAEIFDQTEAAGLDSSNYWGGKSLDLLLLNHQNAGDLSQVRILRHIVDQCKAEWRRQYQASSQHPRQEHQQ